MQRVNGFLNQIDKQVEILVDNLSLIKKTNKQPRPKRQG